jgi:hypothetical protein
MDGVAASKVGTDLHGAESAWGWWGVCSRRGVPAGGGASPAQVGSGGG